METFDRQLFRIVAKIFAVAKSTAVQITREVCLEILRLVTRYIHFLKSRRETAEAVEQFKVFFYNTYSTWSLSTHIPIDAPNVDGKADYFSRKQSYTISTQGLVGENLVFFEVATGFPGGCHDTRNFRNTSMQAKNGEILTKPEDII